MTVYLCPENRSSLGDDTFWTWIHREIPGSSFDVPAAMGPRDVLLQYSTMGAPRVRGGKTVALLWELHPELIERGLPGKWSEPMRRIEACAAACDFRVIASPLMEPFYRKHGGLHCLPIAVDGALFRKRNQAAMRAKHGLPAGKRIGFWGGTSHPMKGFDRVREYAAKARDVHFVTVCKRKGDVVFEGHSSYAHIPQSTIAELMAASDFLLCAGRLRPFYMIEWEAMACDLPVVNVSGLEKDFEPSATPRADVESRGWLRAQAKGAWIDFLTNTVGATL